MTGYTVHTGSTEKFAAGWDEIFGRGSGKKSAAKISPKKSAPKKSVRKTTKSKASRKKR